MKTFTITLHREYTYKDKIFKSERVLKNVVANKMLRDLPNAMSVIYADDTQEVINLSRYDGYKLSREFFELMKVAAEKAAQGKANIQALRDQ